MLASEQTDSQWRFSPTNMGSQQAFRPSWDSTGIQPEFSVDSELGTMVPPEQNPRRAISPSSRNPPNGRRGFRPHCRPRWPRGRPAHDAGGRRLLGVHGVHGTCGGDVPAGHLPPVHAGQLRLRRGLARPARPLCDPGCAAGWAHCVLGAQCYQVDRMRTRSTFFCWNKRGEPQVKTSLLR